MIDVWLKERKKETGERDVPDVLFSKCVKLTSHVHLGKSPQKGFRAGRPFKEMRWGRVITISLTRIKQANQISSLSVKQVGKRTRLPAGARLQLNSSFNEEMI